MRKPTPKMTAGMLSGIVTMNSRIGAAIRWSRRRRRSDAATYPTGSAIATAASDRYTLFQTAGMTPDDVLTVRHVSSVILLGWTSPVQYRDSDTKTSASIGRSVDRTL